jgi:hypothetical protein
VKAALAPRQFCLPLGRRQRRRQQRRQDGDDGWLKYPQAKREHKSKVHHEKFKDKIRCAGQRDFLIAAASSELAIPPLKVTSKGDFNELFAARLNADASLLNAHPPFQIDGNFGGVSGVSEMPLQNSETHADPVSPTGGSYILHLPPAPPPAWANGSITGTNCKVRLGDKEKQLNLKPGGNVKLNASL